MVDITIGEPASDFPFKGSSKMCERGGIVIRIGFVLCNSAKAYIEVMSFDGLVNSATERNRAFFDKLGLPS